MHAKIGGGPPQVVSFLVTGDMLPTNPAVSLVVEKQKIENNLGVPARRINGMEQAILVAQLPRPVVRLFQFAKMNKPQHRGDEYARHSSARCNMWESSPVKNSVSQLPKDSSCQC